MTIKFIYVIDFGALSNTRVEFKEGFNFICLPNEAGKSTIKDSIDAALYGFICGEAKRKLYNENYNKYKNGRYSLSLGIEFDGQSIVIERDLLNEVCRVYDENYNDITNDFRLINKVRVPGYDILGVTPEIYRQIYAIDTGESISSKENLAFINLIRDRDMYDLALENIDYRLTDLGSDKAYTKKRMVNFKKIESLKQEIRELEARLIKSENQYKELNDLEFEEKKLENSIRVIDERLNGLDESGFERKLIFGKKKNVISIVLGLLSFLFLITGYMAYKYYKIYAILIVSLVFLIGFVSSIFVKWKGKKTKKLSLELIELGKQKLHYVELNKDLKNRRGFLEGVIYNSNKDKEEILRKKDKLRQLEDLQSKMDREYMVLSHVRKAIDEANKKFDRKNYGLMKEIASNYFYKITGNDELILDDDFNYYLRREVLLGYEKISQGTAEILLFSIKMAFNEMINKTNFIVFDDAFLSVDDNRLYRVADILYNISLKRQVLFFTSNSRMLKIFEDRKYSFHEVTF